MICLGDEGTPLLSLGACSVRQQRLESQPETARPRSAIDHLIRVQPWPLL